MKERNCPICEKPLVLNSPWYECPRGFPNVNVHQPFMISRKLVEPLEEKEKDEEEVLHRVPGGTEASSPPA